jgi:hypothetical protein
MAKGEYVSDAPQLVCSLTRNSFSDSRASVFPDFDQLSKPGLATFHICNLSLAGGWMIPIRRPFLAWKANGLNRSRVEGEEVI